MSAYETKQKFGGRQARVTDAVVVAGPAHDNPEKVCIRAGEVVAISSSKDQPYILDKGRLDHGLSSRLLFVETKTKEDIESMPLWCWTWPLSPIGIRGEVRHESPHGPESSCG